MLKWSCFGLPFLFVLVILLVIAGEPHPVVRRLSGRRIDINGIRIVVGSASDSLACYLVAVVDVVSSDHG